MPIDRGTDAAGRAPSGDRKLLKLGRYEVVRELGKGAMGVVYLAKDPIIGRLVALKTIRGAAHVDDEEAREFQQRFMREAQAAGILNHAAIVTVHDVGQDDASGTSFIAMEYVEGQNLKEVLSQGRALSFDQIGEIIAQVAEALDYAHAKGIVHRDVKPANVILLEGNRAKITDFGIAKIASGTANLTTTGQFLGTPNYMAPEQVRGAPVDGRTDIFALGICLYECLTRRKPFGGDSLTSISYKIVHEPFPPLHEINPQIPAGYEEVASRCLAKDPAKRYQRARDVASALRAVLRGEKPLRGPDPILTEETVVTAPKLPGATASDDEPRSRENDLGGSTRPLARAADAINAANAAPAGAARGWSPLPENARRFAERVRAMALWRRRIPAAVFIGIVALLVAALIGGVATLRSAQPEIPQVDTAAEARIARERQLRQEGNALLRQGRVTEAYAKYEELHRLAPDSPYVLTVMQKLNAIRQQEEISKQQLDRAEEKFEEGVAFYKDEQYAEAIRSLQQSFSLNPSSNDTVEYLKRAQRELQRVQSERLRPAPVPPAQAQTGAATTAPASTNVSQLTTVFIHPFTDGRILVRAGADIVANEQLFEEKPGHLFRRASRSPRTVSVTQRFPAKNADVQVWVTVPAENIQEHRTLQAVRFNPGTAHRLIVRYDRTSGTFSYELN